MSQMQVVPLRNVPRPAAGPEQNLTTQFVAGALRRWWKTATPLGLLLAAVGGLTVYLLFRPVYEAAAWFKIEERTPFLAFETKDEGRSKVFFQTQIETIRSPLVLGPVIKQPEIARQPQIAREPDKVAWLGKQIKVTSVGESELFRILYTAPDPKDAAAVVNAVTESYFKLRDQSDTERNQRIIDLLSQEQEKRSKEVMRLRDTLRSLAKDATDKDPYSGKTQAESLQKHPLADLEGRLIAAQVEGAVLEARIKAAEEELDEKQRAADAVPATLLSDQEKALRDVMVSRIVEESPEIRRQNEIIAAKRSRLTDAERVMVRGKRPPGYERLLGEIRGDEAALERLRKELRGRAVNEAEASIIAKRTEAGSVQTERRTEELSKLRSDRGAARVMEQILQERYDKEHKQVEQSSGETMELGFKRDELVRAEKVFELIAQRALQLQTERARRRGSR